MKNSEGTVFRRRAIDGDDAIPDRHVHNSPTAEKTFVSLREQGATLVGVELNRYHCKIGSGTGLLPARDSIDEFTGLEIKRPSRTAAWSAKAHNKAIGITQLQRRGAFDQISKRKR
jgi:hypothetical protein